MTSSIRRSQPVTRDFPWKVHVPVEVDWQWIGSSGLMEAMEPYLDKVFNGVQGQFMCLGWRRIFEIQEVFYKELVYEFLATVSFARIDGIYVDDNLIFLPWRGKAFLKPT
ncbi:unnamed protein product [Lactuca saligna]|uniref:Uncharacterized protein n=1 Tax=Lactuca saligna TaxID=75948 RepID=A0AA35VD73_LACSI|nr:unnamed protein product [Lactuca saligna]